MCRLLVIFTSVYVICTKHGCKIISYGSVINRLCITIWLLEQAFPYTVFQPQALELCARVGTLTSVFCLVWFLFIYLCSKRIQVALIYPLLLQTTNPRFIYFKIILSFLLLMWQKVASASGDMRKALWVCRLVNIAARLADHSLTKFPDSI